MQSTQRCCDGTAALPCCPGMQTPITTWAVHGLKGASVQLLKISRTQWAPRSPGLSTCPTQSWGEMMAQAAPGSSSAGLSTSTHAWQSKPHPFHHRCAGGAGWLCSTHTEQSSMLSSQRCALCPWEGSRCAGASSNIGSQSTGFHLPQVNPVPFTGCLLHFLLFFPSHETFKAEVWFALSD